MAEQKWVAPTAVANFMTTELNALATGSSAEVEYNNTSGLKLYALAELYFTHGSAPTADTTHDLYVKIAPNGTDYEDGSASRPPANGSLGSFVCDAVTSAQRKTVRDIVLYPGKNKIMVKNNSGQAMAGSGNIMNLYIYGQQVL